MAEQITKKDLQGMANGIIDAVDLRFRKVEQRMDLFDEKLDKLITTLDRFLKQLSDFKDEFVILKSEVDRIKNVLKEKLGVDIARM